MTVQELRDTLKELRDTLDLIDYVVRHAPDGDVEKSLRAVLVEAGYDYEPAEPPGTW